MSSKIKLIIVEDDPLIAFDIKGIVEEKDYEVVGVFHTAADAMNAMPLEFDIALLDINTDGERDGIELGISLRAKYNKPCIFITSYYDQETIQKAKQANPLAYIIKPYEEQDIIANLELSKGKLTADNRLSEPGLIFVKTGSKLTKINPVDIDYAQAYDMYTHLYTGGRRITASQTLKEFEKIFSGFYFFRVHRSYMVNMDAIEGICEDEILIGEARIPIGRTYKKEFFDKILTI
jgi:DNA-binding LytR/AlgR family response regulator